MNTAVYYFTGTGNSLKIAKDLAKELHDTQLIRICAPNMKIRTDEHERDGG